MRLIEDLDNLNSQDNGFVILELSPNHHCQQNIELSITVDEVCNLFCRLNP